MTLMTTNYILLFFLVAILPKNSSSGYDNIKELADKVNYSEADLSRSSKVTNKLINKAGNDSNLSIIILGTAAAVFTVLIVGVFFVYR